MPAVSCPGGMLADGVICRAPLHCRGGRDDDRDGVPNSCDVCPFVFNPEQSSEPCQPLEGVCQGILEEAVLWSAASAEIVDRKPCPPPLMGTCVYPLARVRLSN